MRSNYNSELEELEEEEEGMAKLMLMFLALVTRVTMRLVTKMLNPGRKANNLVERLSSTWDTQRLTQR